MNLEYQTADVIIHSGMLFTMNEARTVFNNGAIAVKGDTIVAVGPADELCASYRALVTINVAGQLILPGFINGHTHAAMNLFRGIADNVPLATWLKEIMFPLEQTVVDEEFVYWGTLLAGLEMLRSGITTAADMYYHAHGSARAFADIGMRALVGSNIAKNPQDMRLAQQHVERWQGHPLITPALAPHTITSVPYHTLQEIAALSHAQNIPVLIHVAETNYDAECTAQEYGCTPLQLLKREQLLNKNLIIAHGVHLNENECNLLAASGCGIIHCPTSNMKLAAGAAPVCTFLEYGIPVGLGTDGAASNNSLNIIAEMKMAVLLQRLVTKQPDALDALTAVELATIRGAQAIHSEHVIGSIEVGKKADIVGISLQELHQIPVYEPLSTLVYATHAHDVQTVICNGEVKLENGVLTCGNMVLEEVYQKCAEYQKKIRKCLT